MQSFGLIGLLITIAVAAWWLSTAGPVAPPPNITEKASELVLDPTIMAAIAAHADQIVLSSPKPNESVVSPLTLTGQARGTWYFEGSFSVTLTNWDGLIIAEAPATARGVWMTEEFVPFTLTLPFVSPYQTGDPDFMRRGSLILKKDNPSGLVEHDDALEIPVMFSPAGEIAPVSGSQSSYGDAIDSAKNAARQLEF